MAELSDSDEVFHSCSLDSHSSLKPSTSDCSESDNGNLLSPHPTYGNADRSPNRSSLIKDKTKRMGSSKKTVSFSSMPAEKKISNVMDCIFYMQQGCDLVKLRTSSRRYKRHFSLDADCSHLRWTPTNKKPHKARISIDSIKEIRIGRNADNLRGSQGSLEDYTDDCAFSIVWGDQYEYLDLIAPSPDETNIWVTGLMALTSGNCNQTKEKTKSLRDEWLSESFVNFAGSIDAGLQEDQVIKLIKHLNPVIPLGKILQKIKELEYRKTDRARSNTIGFADVADIYKELATRPEIYFLMVRCANKDYLTSEDLLLFLENEQGIQSLTKEKCDEIIEKFEVSKNGRELKQMTVDGFTQYLTSQHCDIFDPLHNSVCQDMTLPLNHYFISASHNTYLVEDQLKGPSVIDGYIRALKKGCRFIELDLWEIEGFDEPIIYHGHTLTSKLPVTKALKAIREFAFEQSLFPLMIQLEIHLTQLQQRVLVKLLKETFGDLLYTTHTDDILPSPLDLKRRILLKGKKLPHSDWQEGEVTEDDESCDSNKSLRNRKFSIAKKRFLLCKELSDLICCLKTTSFYDIPSMLGGQTFDQICSINESLASRLVSGSAEEFIGYNKRFLTRVYPNGVRVDSSNFNPQDFWNCGCQLVAMNFQTPGLMMDLVSGKFSANGKCGYVLKPNGLREEGAFFGSHSDFAPGTTQILHLKVISAQQLPRPRGSSAKGDSCDPYVIIELFGVPSDCAEERTKTIRNDSFNPVFDESFEFHLTVPDLALVRFLVLDDDYIQDDFIGQYTIPFDCLQTGYRYVPLLSSTGEVLENASLFVHIAITNKRGGGKATKRGMSVRKKRHKIQTGIKLLGIKQLDENFKAAVPYVADSIELKNDLDSVVAEFQECCGLGPTASMKQALRLLISRWQAAFPSDEDDKIKLKMHEDCYKLETDVGELPEILKRSMSSFDKVTHTCRAIAENSETIEHKLDDINRKIMESYEDLGQLCMQAGLKGQKAQRASENFSWNIRLLKGQVEVIRKTHKEAKDYLQQIKESAITADILKSCDSETCQKASRLRHNNGHIANNQGSHHASVAHHFSNIN